VTKLLITDVDNTLFDWQHFWFETFSALSERAIEIAGVDPARFYAECSVVHQKYGTSEYSQLLEELPCLHERFGSHVLEAMAPAIDAFRRARRQHLKLFPGVAEALETMRSNGIVVAAFTESLAFYSNYRFRKLGLDGLVDYLYSPPDHEMPIEPTTIRKYPPDTYNLKQTIHHYTPRGELKPNPDILSSIVRDLGFENAETFYVGDNLLKDIFMAQQAGVNDVWAKYGAAQGRKEQYDLLKLVTHWTPEMVEREKAAMTSGAIEPLYTLDTSFAEILPLMGITVDA
jgi:phosphoglycolate phosphatase